MTLRLRITARAAREIERADAWWRENRLSVPGAFRDDLKGAFNLLLQQPGVGTQVVMARLPGTRRLYLKRIRYSLYYRIQGDDLFVLSVWHASRGSGPSI